MRYADEIELRSAYIPDSLPAGNYAYVKIEDNGCGLSQETLTKLFDPFFSTKFTGRGLGLAAVLGIVRAHHGTIQVTSNLGEGSMFEVFFPCSSEEQAVGLHTNTTSQVSSGAGTILVVEDETHIRQCAQRILESGGFNVLTAADGEECLDVFTEHRDKIVAILLDVTMPRMDGKEALKQLRKLETNIPIAMMSGYSEHELAEGLGASGANGFIQKPFQANDLIVRLCRLLPKAALPDPE